ERLLDDLVDDRLDAVPNRLRQPVDGVLQALDAGPAVAGPCVQAAAGVGESLLEFSAAHLQLLDAEDADPDRHVAGVGQSLAEIHGSTLPGDRGGRQPTAGRGCLRSVPKSLADASTCAWVNKVRKGRLVTSAHPWTRSRPIRVRVLHARWARGS